MMNSNKEKILLRLFSGNKQLPTLPTLFTEINRMMANPFVSNKKIAERIMQDQAMVTKILRLSNSALYSKRQEITSLSGAITFLGTVTLRNLILQISLVRVFDLTHAQIPHFSVSTFWEKSLGTAYFADIITRKLSLPSSENYYLAGLLHGIGKLMIYQFYPESFAKAVQLQMEEGLGDVAAEEQVLGVNHCDVGGYLAQSWEFKLEIIDAIQHYQAPLPSHGLIVSLIRISSLFATAAGLCFPWEDNVMDIVGDPAWGILAGFAKDKPDVARLTFEIGDESVNVREAVRELLSSN